MSGTNHRSALGLVDDKSEVEKEEFQLKIDMLKKENKYLKSELKNGISGEQIKKLESVCLTEVK